MSRVLVVGMVFMGLAGMTAQAAAPAAPKPCSGPEYHQFDFFVGDWIATKKDGTPAGTLLMTVEEGGCLLHEHWEGAGGTNGQSLNFYDKNDRRWHQVWVDNEGNWLNLSGTLVGKSMNFTATTTGPGGKRQLLRAGFVDNGDGTAREWYDTSDDNGKSWQPQFDATFTRKK
ncbi:MAG: hypothetical protein ABJC74_00720 [Gemmatimonadota bacterium]